MVSRIELSSLWKSMALEGLPRVGQGRWHACACSRRVGSYFVWRELASSLRGTSVWWATEKWTTKTGLWATTAAPRWQWTAKLGMFFVCLFVGIGLVWFWLWGLFVFPVNRWHLFSHGKIEYSKNEILPVLSQVIKGIDVFSFVTTLKNHNIMI